MKLVYKGKFSGNLNDLPQREHPAGAVKFKEEDNPAALSKKISRFSLAIGAICMVGMFLRAGLDSWNILGILLSLLTLFPHEILHGICFKEEAYIYTNLKNGMMFVVGTEDMTKARFVFMSLLPNIVFGLIPYLVFLIQPQFTALGMMGCLALSMGAGDYYNVYNAVTQMPKGALTYLCGFNSYWYLPNA